MPLFDGWFGPKVGNIQNQNPFLEMVRAMAQSCFHPYAIDEATRTLDLETATMDQLHNAMADCTRCWTTEYPETNDGTYYAFERYDELSSALRRRFPLECEL